MTVVSTFPPSAAFFNENHKYSPLDLDEKSHQDSIAIDMSEADVDVGAGISTSVLARVFEAGSAATHSSQTASSTAEKTNLSVLTPEQENLMKLYDREVTSSSSPMILKPDIFPCSSSSSSCSETNDANLQFYKCRRCRLQCVTTEKWTQTPLAPIYGGNGLPTTTTTNSKMNEDVKEIASLPIHLVGWKNGNSNANMLPLSPSSSSQSAIRSSFSVLPPDSSSSLSSSNVAASVAPSSSRGRIPHASTFPDLGVFPDLVPSAELPNARARLASSSSSSSSRTVHSQTDEMTGLTMTVGGGGVGKHILGTFSDAALSAVSATAAATSFDPLEGGRRRNDSETGSVFGGGWGDIHFGDSINSANVSHADVILDISGEYNNGGGAIGFGGAQSSAGQLVDTPSTATLSTCLEEIALND